MNVAVQSVGWLFGVLTGLRRCMAVSVDCVTEPKMNKGGNPFYGNVLKVQTLNGLVGFVYENAVNNQLAREDNENAFEFVAHERKWGKLMDNRNLVEHTPKGATEPKYYIQLKVQSTGGHPRYLNKRTGQEINVEELRPYLPERRKVGTQEAVGLEKEVIVRDIELGNVKGIRMDGTAYVILPDGITGTPSEKQEAEATLALVGA